MPEARRVALMLDLDLPEKRWRDVALGIRRYAREVGSWLCIPDPFPLAAPTSYDVP